MIEYIILNYNTGSTTAKLIDAILDMNNENLVVAVDNNSTDGSGSMLKDKYDFNERVDLILSSTNEGFARGNNLGYRRAMKHSPDFVVILNSDVDLKSQDISAEIRKIYEENRFAVLGPRITVPETRIEQNPKRMRLYSQAELVQILAAQQKKLSRGTLLRIRAFFKGFTPVRGLYLRHSAKRNLSEAYKKDQFVPILHGAFLVFSPEFFSEFEEPFDPRTFFYFETEILAIRLAKRKMCSYYTTRIQIIHHQNTSTKRSFRNEYAKTLFQIENMIKSIQVCLTYFDK